METIDVSTLNDWIFQNKAHVLLDVREPWEFEHCCIKGSVNIPMSEIQGRLSELDPEIDIVVICHHGSRSMQVAYFLLNSGFINRIINLQGGIAAWTEEIEPQMPHY